MTVSPKDSQAFPNQQPAVQSDWQLQDAKNRFSQVVRAAQAGVPQWVTVHGKRAVVVLSAQEFAQLNNEHMKAQTKPISQILICPIFDGDELDALFAKDRGPGRAHELEF
jgi:antitoxin Phd